MPRPERRSGMIGWLAGGALVVSLLAVASQFGRSTPWLGRFVPRLSRIAPHPVPAGFSEDEASGRGRSGTPPSTDARSSGHETEDMRGALMARLVLLLGVVAGCMIFAMVELRGWVISSHVADQPRLTALQVAPESPPDPHLQVGPVADLARLRAAEGSKLNGYGFVDAASGRARIPIDRAMALSIGQSLEPPP